MKKLTKRERYWLKVGTDIEMEHNLGRKKAKEIALDHIKEFADYYPALVKMEAGLRKRNKK